MILIHNLSWIPELDPTLVSIEKIHKNAYGNKKSIRNEVAFFLCAARHDTTQIVNIIYEV